MTDSTSKITAFTSKITSKITSKSKSRRSARRPDVMADQLILDVNNIQGRRLQNVLSVSIENVRTVHHLKTVISTRHGYSVVALFYRGVCLEDDRQLAHLMPDLLKIGNSPRFSVKTRLGTIIKPGDVSLFVKSLQGSTFQVHLPAHSTIADLKNAIRDWEGYSSEQDVQITCSGKNLSAEDLALATCNLVPGSVVHVVGRLLGGEADQRGGPLQSFVDMENMSALRTCNVRAPTPEDPDWKVLHHGLNIQGTCRNAKCAAYLSTVRCEKGFTAFNIVEAVKCPSCKTNFTAATCGFWNCEWMFEGRKTGVSSIDMMSTWHVTAKDKFQWFDEAGGRNTSDWSSLIITTRKLASDAGAGPASLEQVGTEKCVLCFGLTSAFTPRARTSDHAKPCGHAVHPGCAREFRVAGYNTCPTCRLPLGHGQA